MANLIVRYAGRINILEISNEPNWAGWPHVNSSGAVISPCFVTQMFQTATIANNFLGAPVLLGGPATLDVEGTTNTRVDYLQFTQSLLQLNASANHRDPRFVWTIHNYGDVERDMNARAAAVVSALASGGWPGYTDGVSAPTVLCTEGGARLPNLGWNYTTQDALTRNALVRLQNTSGIGMYTNYLVYGTGIGDDSGLMDQYGNARPVYNTWASTIPGRR